MRVPTSRWSTAARRSSGGSTEGRRTARESSASPSTARRCSDSSRSGRSAFIQESVERFRERGRVGQERNMACACDRDEARIRKRRRKPRAGGRWCERVALAHDHQRGLRDRRRVGAQIGGPQDGERLGQRGGAGSPRANRSRRSAASVPRASALPASCSDRNRCSVSRYDAANSSPNWATVCLAIAWGQSSRATKQGVVATRTRRAIRSGAVRAQRSATAPPSDQPTTMSGSPATSSARETAPVSASSVQGLTGSL